MSNYLKVNECLAKGIKLENLTCDYCNKPLKYYRSKYGIFIGCPNYIRNNNCRNTLSVYGSPKDLERFGIKPVV